ncbi:unnamed protein product [Protopolystoma xenopodis]|uniref:Uncharacterized protein n=1 Tax=Protopolystoma xenopodis TaxID=117903 RepID=A0A448XER8_9PLAT|nr:unnamed protein product [Protopolystoma xenopodis]
MASEDQKEDIMIRRKSRSVVTRDPVIFGAQTPITQAKGMTSASCCKVENLFARFGWNQLLVGVRGGQWQVYKGAFSLTPKTLTFDTTQLGK